MELREFAERVLLATTLEEKLARPDGDVTDERPGAPLLPPSAPGRPDTLKFARGRDRPPPPRAHSIQSDEESASLLHAFANHELLAAELMALVLLRFPDAPSEFRQGVFETLLEEQHHTRWYLHRLRQNGVEPGAFAVTGFFWDAVASMETPLDFVSRLSLTFEQANLDYARHYARLFGEAGDTQTAAVLDRIYRDEIDHVRHGLTWFRRWKDPAKSDWETFEERLQFPLSPSRAKGNGGAPFNPEGRLAAGLDDAFVRRLRLFERSKGRTPRVFWFDPDAEGAMLPTDGATVPESSAGRQVALDLECLAAFLARRDDVVLVRRLPSLEWRERMAQLGFQLPEFEALTPGGDLSPESLTARRKLASLRPWSWSPRAAELMRPLESRLPTSARSIDEDWNPKTRRLFAKDLAAGWLADWVEANPGSFDPAAIGRFVRTEAEAEAAVEAFSRAGYPRCVVKAPFGCSGRRNRLWDPGRSPNWLGRILSQQGGVLVEPWLDRVFDFSVQFALGDQGLRRLGFVRLRNSAGGQFEAAWTGPKFCQGMSPALARFLNDGVLTLYDENLREFLETRLVEAGYAGPVGIDAFVFRTREGNLALKPIVEMNPRHTLGRVALELRRRVAPGHGVELQLRVGAPIDGGWTSQPLPETPLRGGTHLLNQPRSTRSLQAFLRVSRQPPVWPQDDRG